MCAAGLSNLSAGFVCYSGGELEWWLQIYSVAGSFGIETAIPQGCPGRRNREDHRGLDAAKTHAIWFLLSMGG